MSHHGIAHFQYSAQTWNVAIVKHIRKVVVWVVVYIYTWGNLKKQGLSVCFKAHTQALFLQIPPSIYIYYNSYYNFPYMFYNGHVPGLCRVLKMGNSMVTHVTFWTKSMDKSFSLMIYSFLHSNYCIQNEIQYIPMQS